MAKKRVTFPAKEWNQYIAPSKTEEHFAAIIGVLEEKESQNSDKIEGCLLAAVIINSHQRGLSVRQYPDDINLPFGTAHYQDICIEYPVSGEAQPYLEWLYENEYQQFCELVGHFQSSLFFKNFISALEKTSLKHLLSWNGNMKTNLTANIKDMAEYGKKLQDENSSFILGSEIISHAKELDDIIKMSPETASMKIPSNKDTDEDKKNILGFKLNFITTARKNDELYKADKDYCLIITFITNALTFLLPPLFAYNIHHRLTKGTWLFFDKKTAQERINQNLSELVPGDTASLKNSFYECVEQSAGLLSDIAMPSPAKIRYV